VLVVAIAPILFETGESPERATFKALQRTLELEAVLIKADVRATEPGLLSPSPSRAPKVF
jgi:hypothetical protein